MLRIFLLFVFIKFSFTLAQNCNMVYIPSGKYTPLFKYGEDLSDDSIYVNDFYIDKYPVTNLFYKNFLLINFFLYNFLLNLFLKQCEAIELIFLVGACILEDRMRFLAG